MRAGLSVAVLFAAAFPLFAQQPASAPPEGASSPPDTVCAKAVTIYIDASGTMTQPVRNRGGRLPISDVAQTLLRFITAENFLATGDTVTIKFFGSAVRTQAEDRQASVALLTQLADPSSAPAAAAALRSGDLRNLTDFARLFDDMDNRLRNAALRRQIIFIASDFAHDHLNNSGCPNDVTARMENFSAALERIRARLADSANQDSETFGRVEIAGLFAPEGSCRSDNEVARQVQEGLKSLGMRLYRYDEDAAEAALTINNQLIGTVTAQPATQGVVRIEADNRIAFRVGNPNCVDASIVALQFDTGTGIHKVEVGPVIVSGSTSEVRVDVDKLAAVWNRDTRVTPVIAAGTSLSAETSSTFWLGDWIRVRRLTPYFYPRTFREGQTLIAATLERSLRAPAGLTVAGIDAGSRSRLFELEEGNGEELYLLPFDLNSASAGRLGGAGATANLGTTGIRLLTDEITAVPNTLWPLTSGATSSAATLIDWIAAGSLGGYVAIFLLVVFRTFSRDGDAESGEQRSLLLSRTKGLASGSLLSTALLLSRFRSPLTPDMQMFLLGGWRAAAAGLATFLLLRAVLVETFWKQRVEPRLLPSDRAVTYRRRWNGLIYLVAVAVTLWIVYAFFWAPASVPPPGASVLKGVSR